MFWFRKKEVKLEEKNTDKEIKLLEDGVIDFDYFSKVDLRVAKILSAERVPGSDKLLKLEADLGNEKRQILAGIGKVYSPESIVGKEIVVVANLEPRKMMGFVSQGMVLASGDSNNLSLIYPDKEITAGSKVS